MSLRREWFGPSREEIWRQLCGQIDARYVEGGFWKGDHVEATHRQWTITLDVYVVNTGKTSIPYTRLRAPFVNPEGFRFSIGPKSLFHMIGVLTGAQDIQVGDRDFDEQFAIKGNNEEKVRQLFQNARLRELLRAHGSTQLSVRDDDGFFGPRFPEGVDQLVLSTFGVVKEIDKLKSFFELFAVTLDELCKIGAAYEDAPDFKTRR